MQDAMKFMEMNHTAEIRQLKEDLAPGFVWPDQDQSAKAARLEAELTNVTAERDGCWPATKAGTWRKSQDTPRRDPT